MFGFKRKKIAPSISGVLNLSNSPLTVKDFTSKKKYLKYLYDRFKSGSLTEDEYLNKIKNI